MNKYAPSTGCWVSQTLTNGTERTGIVIQKVVDGERVRVIWTLLYIEKSQEVEKIR